MNSQNRDNTKPKAEKKDKCARCGEPQLSTIHKFVKDGFGHTFIDISLNKQPTLKPNGWEELKEKLREVRKEAKITFIESPYGYIDDSFFENKAWKVIEESLSQAILSAEKETVKRIVKLIKDNDKNYDFGFGGVQIINLIIESSKGLLERVTRER